MAFAWADTSQPTNLADDRDADRQRVAGSKRSRWPRYARALATDGRTLTDEPQLHLEATGTLGPPVLDVAQAKQDYARAAQHAHLAQGKGQAHASPARAGAQAMDD